MKELSTNTIAELIAYCVRSLCQCTVFSERSECGNYVRVCGGNLLGELGWRLWSGISLISLSKHSPDADHSFIIKLTMIPRSSRKKISIQHTPTDVKKVRKRSV